MDTLIYFAIFILGVLNVILFFKIWGMTNDIDKIMTKYCQEDKTPLLIVKQLILCGKTRDATDVLNQILADYMQERYRHWYGTLNPDELFRKEIDAKIEALKPFYDAAGTAVSEHLAKISFSDYNNFGKKS